MSETEITILSCVLTPLIGLTAFGGKHVAEEPKDIIWLRRITCRGYAFLMLTIIVIGLNIYKETTRLASLSGKLPENFYTLTKNITGYGEGEWNRFIAIRLALRYQLGTLYKKTPDRSEKPTDPPESIETLLLYLTKEGVIGDNLCQELDNIRDKTYAFEWARGTRPTELELNVVREKAPVALKELRQLDMLPRVPSRLQTQHV